MNKLLFAVLVLNLATFLSPVSGATPSRYWVSFAGEITSSVAIKPAASQFADFSIGAGFRGSFLFDAALVDRWDSLVVTSGSLQRYFACVRDFRVEYNLANGPYVYQPPVYGSGSNSNVPLQLFGVGNNVNESWDGIDMRFQNYPLRWSGGPLGVTYGAVPASQFVRGLYPHSSFLVLQDSVPPLDALNSSHLLLDLEDLFSKSDYKNFSIRFTNANDPNWQGREQLYAVVYGNISSLRVSLTPVPEPNAVAFAGISAIAFVLAHCSRSSADRGAA